MLATADLNVERVRQRVKTGGHDVPEDRIRARRERSLAQLPWFIDQADYAVAYDNSLAEPRLFAEKRGGTLAVDPSAPEDFRNAIAGLGD